MTTKLSRILLIVFGAPAGYLAYLLFAPEKTPYGYLLIPLGICLATTLIFQHQIDIWWLKRTKPKLDNQLRNILRRKLSKFDNIWGLSHWTETDLIVFADNCDFMGQGLESIPDDLKYAIAAHAFYFGRPEDSKWPDQYNRIALYPHPFLSPNIDTTVHSVEHHEDDGVFIFSLEQGLPAMDAPDQFFNVFLYGFASAYLDLYPVRSEESDDEIWRKLTIITGIPQERIEAVIGLPEINVLAVLAHYYVTKTTAVRLAFPSFKDTLFARMHVSAEKS